MQVSLGGRNLSFETQCTPSTALYSENFFAIRPVLKMIMKTQRVYQFGDCLMLSGRSININYVYFIFSLFISAFIGLVSYQFNILCLGKHYELFVQKDIDIINGVANIRAFQQRVIPSLVENSSQ